ncbi:MAG: hypothetical protein MR757_00045, partial [Proteobacteria bacterium]|nr:hypothetical protein [Pseudomonadota bacterium]
STTRLRLLDDRDMVIQTMNISSSKSSIPAERSMSGTSDHTENVIEPTFLIKIAGTFCWHISRIKPHVRFQGRALLLLLFLMHMPAGTQYGTPCACHEV